MYRKLTLISIAFTAYKIFNNVKLIDKLLIIDFSLIPPAPYLQFWKRE